MKIGVFHPGTQHSWQSALAFQESGNLKWYATSIFYDPKRWPYKIENWLPNAARQKIRRELTRRYTKVLDPALVRRLGIWEWLEIGASRCGAAKISSWCNLRGNYDFGRLVIKLVQKEPVDILWGYNSASLEVFRWAKRHGIVCILDQTTGHPLAQNQILLEEQERHPHFFETSFEPYDNDWVERQNEEIALADVIVVGSDFCAKTLIQNKCPAHKIKVINYGFDEVNFHSPRSVRDLNDKRPLKFLFVGQLSARKGIAYLLKAFEHVPKDKATLVLVGGCAIPREIYQSYSKHFHHVQPVPRSEVVRYFCDSDCFIFPSLFEGSALVLNEACGSGLGIIQSASSGHGVHAHRNGIIIESVSVEAVLSNVMKVIAAPETLSKWQAESQALRSSYMWSNYRQKLRGLAWEVAGKAQRNAVPEMLEASLR